MDQMEYFKYHAYGNKSHSLVAYATWNIWLNRNNLIFQAKHDTLDFIVKKMLIPNL